MYVFVKKKINNISKIHKSAEYLKKTQNKNINHENSPQNNRSSRKYRKRISK